MKKSKRQQQVDRLEKLLERIKAGRGSMGDKKLHAHWVKKKMKEVEGGDMELESGGLSTSDMRQANRYWHEYEYINPVTGQ
jgi:hypothetical protein